MSHGPSFERDLRPLQRLLDGALKGIQAGEAVLLHHSRPNARLVGTNFPREESLLGEAVALVRDWKVQTAALLRRLDMEAASATLHFERLFDANAGRQAEGFLRRRAHLGHAAPETIAAGLVDLLSVSVAVDDMLKTARPAIVDVHRLCESHLLRLITRRQQIDVELEDASRRIAGMKAQPHDRQPIRFYGQTRASESAFEEERRLLALDRQAGEVRDEGLLSERETLQRMIADDEDFVEALNAGIGATNVMRVKLAVDIEQRIALLKAVNLQSSVAVAALPAPLQALVSAFEANSLAGHDLPARRKRADAAFSRRFSEPASVPQGQAGEAGEADIGTGSPQAPI